MLPSNERAHTAKMLNRARRWQTQANRLVEKWAAKLAVLGPDPAEPDQPCLWVDDDSGSIFTVETENNLPLPFDNGLSEEETHAGP